MLDSEGNDGDGVDAEKIHKSGYLRTVVTLNNLRDSAREVIGSLKGRGVVQRLQEGCSRCRDLFKRPKDPVCSHVPPAYAYMFRSKSRWELVMLSGTVCGIEFCYSAETAFVTPVLLGLGLRIEFVTMIWCLSPLIGFFLTPVLGSMSDTCGSRWGRRRPFILLYSVGILLGLLLVPNGNRIGLALGDTPNILPLSDTEGAREQHLQPWSIAFTVVGTVLLDFCSDACQSPSRTLLLDVSLPSDQTTGLSTFTVMAGLGGSVGYMMGALHWESTPLGRLLGDQVTAVFSIVTVVFLACLFLTVCVFPEIPLGILRDPDIYEEFQQNMRITEHRDGETELDVVQGDYGSTATANGYDPNAATTAMPPSEINEAAPLPKESSPTLREYLRSIVQQPQSLRILCLTNLFSWMSLVCYSLYFTDFVGEVVYGGDPQASEGSSAYNLYKEGVRFACWGMALYSVSCSVYSFFIEALVKRLGARRVYVGGQLVYSLGMVAMAAARHPVAVILLSPTAGVMYSTLFTMPYLLIAHYHSTQKFGDSGESDSGRVRGIGTDVASVSSMVFLSQFFLSLTMGSIVAAVGSNVATVCAAAMLSACAALCATRVTYLDL